jgi:pimeloyl-ACP methyl ester carboxylesterase
VALLAAVLILAGLKLSEPSVTPSGEMVDIGGYRLRIDCTGPQNTQLPTVIIESGATGLAQHYYWMQQRLSQQVRTCSYDRVGTGWSEDNAEPHDAVHFSPQLHALLQKAGVKPPYVLAGHSLGGVVIRVYASDYPSDVAGLVFLDSSHPDQVAKLPQPPGPASSPDKLLLLTKALQFAAATGLAHLYNPLANGLYEGTWFQALPPERREQLIALTYRAQTYKGLREEFLGLEDSFRQGGLLKSLGDLPLLVISAGETPTVPGVSDQWLHDFLAAVGKLHDDLATLSTHGRRIVLPGNHISLVVQKDNAEKVAEAILELVHQAADVRSLQ